MDRIQITQENFNQQYNVVQQEPKVVLPARIRKNRKRHSKNRSEMRFQDHDNTKHNVQPIVDDKIDNKQIGKIKRNPKRSPQVEARPQKKASSTLLYEKVLNSSYITNQSTDILKTSDITIQIQQFQQDFQENLLPKKKRIVLLLFSCFFSLVIIIFLVGYQLLMTGSSQDSGRPGFGQYIIDRKFKVGNIYHHAYNLSTLYDNVTLQVDYDFTVAVVGKTNDDITHFVGAILKRRQSKMQDNGNNTSVSFSDYNPYLQILKNGGDRFQARENISLQIVTDQNYTELITQLNISKVFVPVLTIFRFSLYPNGKAASFTVPVKLQKQNVGLLRNAVKMFSPILNSKLYTQDQTVQKSKLTYSGGRTQTITQNGRNLQTINNTAYNNTGNYTSPEAQYSQVKSYSYESQDNKTTLYNKGETSSTAQTHNTQQNTTQSTQFNDDGVLTKGQSNANTNFQSVYQEPSNQYSVLNLNLNISVVQSGQIVIDQFFSATQQHINQYQSLIVYYEQKNTTITLNSLQLYEYIMDLSGDQQADNISSRLLVQADGSINLVNFLKQVPIVQTNLLGCQIGLYGYTQLSLKLYQNPTNKNKKTPKFVAQAGALLKLGRKRFPIPIMQYNKQFPPISLKFTLQQIQIVVNLIKGAFLISISQIENLLSIPQIKVEIFPSIDLVLKQLQDLTSIVSNLQNQIFPFQIIQYLKQIQNILNTSGFQIVNPQVQFVANLSSQLMQFRNLRYAAALHAFNSAKQSLLQLKNQGVTYLQSLLFNLTINIFPPVQTDIRNLIPSDIYEQYERQMQKAMPILQLIQIVQRNGTTYLDYIRSTFDSEKQNYLRFIKGLGDLYFRNQTVKTDETLATINERYTNITNEIFSLEAQVASFDRNQLYQKSLTLLRSIVNTYFIPAYGGDHIAAIRQKLEHLKNITQLYMPGNTQCCFGQAKLPIIGCINDNPAYQLNIAQNALFEQMSAIVDQQFTIVVGKANQYAINSKQIVDSTTLTLQQMYNQINQTYLQLKLMQPSTFFDQMLLKVQQRVNQSLINYQTCCPNAYNPDIYDYHTNLSALWTYIAQVKQNYSIFSLNIQYVINTFSPQAYNSILQHFVFLPQINEFLAIYNSSEHNTTQVIWRLEDIGAGFDRVKFTQSDKFIQQVKVVYDNLEEKLNVLCESLPENNQTIMLIRNQYSQKLSIMNNISNGFLNWQLTLTKDFLNKAIQIYQPFLQTEFCQHKIRFRTQINTLYPDIEYMRVLYKFYFNLLQTIQSNRQQIGPIQQNINNLLQQFYQQFQPQGFRSFILGIENLTELIKQYTTNVSLSYSNLKELAKGMLYFQFAPMQEINQSLALYTDPRFWYRGDELFMGLSDYVDAALDILSKLSYDIIAIVVIHKDVYKYFNQTVENFVTGDPIFSANLSRICQNFLNLNQSSEQKYLNQIHKEFKQLVPKINSTLFPTLQQRKNKIINRYQKFQFQSKYIAQLRKNCFKELKDFAYETGLTKNQTYYKLWTILQLASQIIQKLEIGNLNEIYMYSLFVKEEFNNFVSNFTMEVTNIDRLIKSIQADLGQIFNIQNYLDKMKQRISFNYSQIISNIKIRKEHLISSLKSNLALFNQFSAFSQSRSFTKIEQKLNLNFTSIWNLIVNTQELIKVFLTNFPADKSSLVQELSEIYNKISGVRQKVQAKMQRINELLFYINCKLRQFRDLVFVDISKEFIEDVKVKFQEVVNELKSISDIDFGFINQLPSLPICIKVPQIGVAVNEIFNAFNIFLPLQTSVLADVNLGLSKISFFIGSELAQKMQILKQATLFIKSFVDDIDNPMSIVLYQKQAFEKRIDLVNCKQSFVTPIGIFAITFDMDFVLTISGRVVLSDLRDVNFQVVFSAGLEIDLKFGYGLANILEFGLFVDGYLVRCELTPGIEFNNLIPYQLVTRLAKIPQINSQNIVNVLFRIDLAIYAVQLQVGFYIGHVWIQIIWVDLCIFSLCFKLPIGFKFTMKYHEYGWSIPGIQIAKYRLVSLQILKWQY